MSTQNTKKVTFHRKFTNRGFAYRTFLDHNQVKCSIQKSSLAFIDCIWLGADDIGLKEFKTGEGWKDVPLVDCVDHHFIANTRMHLDRKTVKKLLPILQKFADTGEL